MNAISCLIFTLISLHSLDDDSKVSERLKVPKCILEYPQKAIKNNIQGTVKIKVVFNKDCKIKELMVVKSLGYGCDESQ